MRWNNLLNGQKLFLDAPVVQRIFYFKDNRRRDLDNFEAGTKYYLDGMTQARCFEDDSLCTFLPSLKRKSEIPRLEIYLFSSIPEKTVLK